MTISTSVLNEIHRLHSSGKQIGLFIGRRPYEEIPNEEGTVWVSLDEGVSKIHQTGNLPVLRDLHLHANCLDPQILETLHALFDKVVVDRSTYKFFPASIDQLNPGQKEFVQVAERLMGLLRPGGTLICDFYLAKPRLISLPGSAEEREMLKEIKLSQGLSLFKLQFHNNNPSNANTSQGSGLESIRQLLSEERATRRAERESGVLVNRWDIVDYCFDNPGQERERYLEIKEYLKRFFKSVKYHQHEPFPYKNRYEPSQDAPETLSKYREANMLMPYLVASGFCPR
ncbi:MAG: hypothetical protein RLZZ453_860 [Chlamydiota bacterium]|jgi:hypothetical protein